MFVLQFVEEKKNEMEHMTGNCGVGKNVGFHNLDINLITPIDPNISQLLKNLTCNSHQDLTFSWWKF